MKKNYDYTQSDIVRKLKESSIQLGDSIFIHSNLGLFGQLEQAKNSVVYCQMFKDAIFEVIGPEGTLVVPTFSMSFCNNEIFDQDTTPSHECGIFSEFIRKDSDSIRSNDANFSVAAIGKNANFFTENAPEFSFGKGSFWEKFLLKNGKLCRFNLHANYITFIHYVEKFLKVDYRKDKFFSGYSIIDGKKTACKFAHFVRDLSNENHATDLTKLEKRSIELGLLKVINLGRGKIYCISARDLVMLVTKEIRKDSSFLIKGII